MRKKLVFLSAIVFILAILTSIFVNTKNRKNSIELYAICCADKSKLSFGSFDGITLVNETFLGFDDNRHYYCDDLEVYDGFIEYFTNDNNIKCEGNTHDRSTFVYLYNGMYYGVEMLHLVNGEGETFHILTYSFVSLEDGCLVPTFYGFAGGFFHDTDDKIGENMYEIDYSKFCRDDLIPLKNNSKEGILKFYKNIDPKYVDILDNVITFKNIKSNKATFKMTLNDDSMIIEEIIYSLRDDIRVVDNNQNVEICAGAFGKKLSFGEYSDVKREQFSTSYSDFYDKFYCKTEEKYNEILSIFELDDKNIKCDNNTFVYLYEGMYYGVTFKTYADDNQNKIYEILTYVFVSYDRKAIATFYGSYSSILTNAKFYDSIKKKYIVPYDEMFDMINSNTDLNPLKITNKDGILSFYKNISSDFVEILGDTVKFKNCNGDFIEKITFYDTYLEVEKM